MLAISCVLEFVSNSRQVVVEEPEDGELPRDLTLTVQRTGGSVGVVSVSWRVTSSAGKIHLQMHH